LHTLQSRIYFPRQSSAGGKFSYDTKNRQREKAAETLVKPCSMEMAKLMFGKDAKLKVAEIPLSNDAIRNQIEAMAEGICRQVLK
jgi:hypothetical protein